MRATTTCLIAHDRVKYSVDAKAAGRAVLVRVYADRIVALLGEEVVADHPRSFRRDQVAYDHWHYLPVLMQAGRAQEWRAIQRLELPAPLSAIRARLQHHADGDRQFVKILGRVPQDGVAAVAQVCAEAWRPERQWRCCAGDPRPHAATAGAAEHYDARGAQAQDRADRRLRSIRQSAPAKGGRKLERHQIIDAMTGLKLYGMRASFDEIAGKGLARRDELYPLLRSLIRAELPHRQSRSINYRISGARFPVLKDLEAFIFEGSPVDEGQIRELAAGDFIDAKRNLILIGGTGTGKTHLAIATVAAVIRARARGRFFNLVDLVNQLEQEKAAGRSGRIVEALLRHDLIVIDELGYLPFSESGAQLLFHLISKLYENTSMS
jgi:DNA replication protein DnaC